MNTPLTSSRLSDFLIDVRQVSKHYGDLPVLQGIDLHVRRGEFVAIVGRSGCGKSTLLRLIAGLEKCDAGRVVVEADSVRLMFQDARLLPWKSVIDNVALGLSDDGRSVALDALAAVGLAQRAGEWPAILSGGQRQRVALARALVRRPQVLLLDEPLGALDALTRIEMHALIEDLWREHGFTVVLVTHDVQEAVALADRVVVLEAGQVVLDQTIDLTRPRQRGTQAFAAFEAKVLHRVLAREDI